MMLMNIAPCGRLCGDLVENEAKKTLSLAPLKNRGMSNAFSLIIGIFGIMAFGFAYTIIDQITMNDVWNFGVTQQLNGTYLNIFKMLFLFLPIAVLLAFIVGTIVNSHMTRNEM